MTNFLKNEIDYDSPLKHFSYLEFNSYEVDIKASSNFNDYQKIKKLIDKESCNKLINVVKKHFKKKENDEKRINYLVFGFPRCYFDSLMFDIQIISLITFNKLKFEFESYGKKRNSIGGVFTVYIGFAKLNAYSVMDDAGIGSYYIIQSYSGSARMKVLKKIVINWEVFDPAFYSFRKSNFIETHGPEFNFCKKLGNDLSYYLDIWIKNYITTELYFYKYLCEKEKSKRMLKKEPQHHTSTPSFKIRHQQKAINFLLKSFTNPLISTLLETKFFWKRSHLEKYVSWISYNNDMSLPFFLPSFAKIVSNSSFNTETTIFIPNQHYNSKFQVKLPFQKSHLSQNHLNHVDILFAGKCLEENSIKRKYQISKETLLTKDEKSHFLESLKKEPESDLKQKFACFNNYKNCEILIQNLYKNDKKETQLFFKQQFLNNNKSYLNSLFLSSTKVSTLIKSRDLIQSNKHIESIYLFSNNWIHTFEAFWIFFCDYIIYELEEFDIKFDNRLFYYKTQDHSLYLKGKIFKAKTIDEMDFDFLTSRKHENDILNVDIEDNGLTKRIYNTKKMIYKYWNYVIS